MSTFTLHRAAATDLPAILDAEYDSFVEPIRTLVLGAPDKTYLPRLVKHSQEELRGNPHLIWLYVRDESSGKIVAASNWKIFLGPGWEQSGHADDTVVQWLGKDGVGTAEDKQTSEALLERMNARRLAAVGGGGFVRECLPPLFFDHHTSCSLDPVHLLLFPLLTHLKGPDNWTQYRIILINRASCRPPYMFHPSRFPTTWCWIHVCCGS